MNTLTLTKVATGMIMGACLTLSLTAGAAHAAEGKGGRFDFDACDTNKDGVLSKMEYEAYMVKKAKEIADKRFDALDKNHDGSVTKEEMSEHAKARKENWNKKREGGQSKTN